MQEISQKQKLQLVGVPAAIAIVVGGVYLYFRPQLNPLITGDEGAMTSGVVALLATLYAIIGGFCVFEVLKQWNAVWGAYKTHNEEKYKEYVDLRLPWHFKAAWASTSLLLCVAIALTYWHNPLTAGFAIFVVTYGTIFWWRVVTDLDDYHSGYWNIPTPHDNWWTTGGMS